MKRMFHQHKLNPGEGGTIAEFSRNCIVPLKFVKKDYVDHLAQIEMRKEKRRTESADQMSSLKVHELNLYLVRHGIVFNGKRPEKVAYI